MTKDSFMEIWKSIPNFDGYEVSNLGRIRSWKRSLNPPVEVSLISNDKYKNYYRVPLYTKTGRRWLAVHRAVLLAFVGQPKRGQICCHNDGNGKNNKLSNLRWGTIRDNEADKLRHDMVVRGERVGTSFLKNEQIVDIRKRYQQGEKSLSLSKKFGVHRSTIERVVFRKTWAHIDD